MKLQKIITSFYQIIRKKILWSKKINYLKNNTIKSLDKPKFNQIKYKSSLKILHTKQSQIKDLKSLKFTHCCSLSLSHTLALCLSLSQLYFSFDLIKDLTWGIVCFTLSLFKTWFFSFPLCIVNLHVCFLFFFSSWCTFVDCSCAVGLLFLTGLWK